MSATLPPDDSDDADRTSLIPTPGKGRRPAAAGSPAERAVPAGAPAREEGTLFTPVQRPPASGSSEPAVAQVSGERGTPGQTALASNGLNPLVAAANPLLNLVAPLRAMPSHADLEGLRAQLQGAVRAFEAQGRAAQVPTQALAAARYALCTLLDETISGTPWGGSGVWASRSLLVQFHNEAFGGEKFFLILQKFEEDPGANLDCLELYYVCLALGFEGRYRILDNGRAQLDRLRERLRELIRAQRGAAERELSPHWQGVVDKRNRLLALVPLWVVAAVAGVLLAGLHLLLGSSLDACSDPVFSELHAIKVAAAAPPAAPAALVLTGSAAPRLKVLLKGDIDAGRLQVDESLGKATISVRGDGLFASGSSEIDAAVLPLLARVGDALRVYPGNVLVTGHTDDQRIMSARFPSNWKLSLERANAVLQMLSAQTAAPERFRAAGRGETEPLVPNDSPEHRARNRRVDITITGGGA